MMALQYQTVRLSADFLTFRKDLPGSHNGEIPTTDIDNALNHMASYGYRLVSTSVTGKMSLGSGRTDRVDMYLFFEREIP